jgi:hypothetical protein
MHRARANADDIAVAPGYLPEVMRSETLRPTWRGLRIVSVAALAAAADPTALTAQSARPAPQAQPAPGSALPAGAFLAMRIDSAALPLSDRVTDDEGTTYLVEFDRLVLTLRSGSRFRASIQFKRTMVSADRRAQSRAIPLQTMTVTGRYVVDGAVIRFDPDSTGDGKGLRILSGTIDGPRRISVPFDYRNGSVQRRRILELHRRDDIL